MVFNGKNNLLGLFKPHTTLSYHEYNETTLGLDKYEYHPQIDALNVNVATTGVSSNIKIFIGTHPVGTVLKFKVEVLNFSGDKCNIGFDYLKEGVTGLVDSTLDHKKSEHIGQFEYLTGSVTVTQSKPIMLNVGLWSNETGNFAVRSVEINTENRKSTRAYTIHMGWGIASQIPNKTYDDCTISHSGDTITITHKRPFAPTQHSVAVGTMSASSPGKYQIKTGSETNKKVEVKIYNNETNEYETISNVMSGQEVYFNILCVGVDE